MSDDPDKRDGQLKIVWPTKEEMHEGMAKVERHRPFWTTNPALLIIKPRLGVIVFVRSMEHDEQGFTLNLTVINAIVAPANFDQRAPVAITCLWNQPYLSMSDTCISAPYSFYLHFGTEGVERCLKFAATWIRDTGVADGNRLGLLRRCFRSDFDPTAKG